MAAVVVVTGMVPKEPWAAWPWRRTKPRGDPGPDGEVSQLRVPWAGAAAKRREQLALGGGRRRSPGSGDRSSLTSGVGEFFLVLSSGRSFVRG